MFLRAILAAALLGSASVAWADPGPPGGRCISHDRIMAYVADDLHISSPPVAHNGIEADGIVSGLVRANAGLKEARSFLSFALPLDDKVLLVVFKDNCAVGMIKIPAAIFRLWVEGQRAGR